MILIPHSGMYLTFDSPELNPDELVWNRLKNYRIGRRTTATGPDDSKRKVLSIFRSLQNDVREKQVSFKTYTFDIKIQRFKAPIDLFSQSDLVNILQHRYMESFANTTGLGSLP